MGFTYVVGHLIFALFFFFAGYLLFKDFCENVVEEPIPQIKFYEEVCTLF